MEKRVFLIILDSFGIGNAPDAALFGDEGSNTLQSVSQGKDFHAPALKSLGLFNIDDVSCGKKSPTPSGSYARLQEASMGKDTTVGHWEIAGVTSPQALPVFPNGFPISFIEKFEKACGHKTLCNQPYSGTQVLQDFGEMHLDTGDLIIYTSADSVFQIASHEDIVPIAELYQICQLARDMLKDELAVGRVIARPFIGTNKNNFKRTANRHDYSLSPPNTTMLDILSKSGFQTIGVGKIHDIFNGMGLTKTLRSKGNDDGMRITLELANSRFSGLAFINLVDFDMLYGHRNDVDGYSLAISHFDAQLAQLLPMLRDNDMLIITADHGCDPSTPSTDHSRECVPLLIYGNHIKKGVNLETIHGFSVIANIVCEFLNVPHDFPSSGVNEKIFI